MIASYKGRRPKLGRGVFIAPTACVIGDVEVGDGTSIWYGAVVRGDCAKITIGRNTNIQDNVTLHVDDGTPLVIGDHVTIGHNAVVHGCTVGDDCIVGMGSVILSSAVVQRGSIIASGSVVTERSVVREFTMAAGAPAVVKKELGPGISEKNREGALAYRDLAGAHRAALEESKNIRVHDTDT